MTQCPLSKCLEILGLFCFSFISAWSMDRYVFLSTHFPGCHNDLVAVFAVAIAVAVMDQLFDQVPNPK